MEAGANLRAEDECGNTALEIALEQGRQELSDYLLVAMTQNEAWELLSVVEDLISQSSHCGKSWLKWESDRENNTTQLDYHEERDHYRIIPTYDARQEGMSGGD